MHFKCHESQSAFEIEKAIKIQDLQPTLENNTDDQASNNATQ